MNSNQLVKTACATALTLGMATLASTAMAQNSMQMTPQQTKMQQQKTMTTMKTKNYAPCYGVNAAYKNDCKSPGHSCAGQDSKANDPQAFVAMPSGLCTKIAGGSLTKA